MCPTQISFGTIKFILSYLILSPTPRRNAIAPEMDVISTLTYLATGQMQLCSSGDLGQSQPFIRKVITQTFIALSELYYVTVHFLKIS